MPGTAREAYKIPQPSDKDFRSLEWPVSNTFLMRLSLPLIVLALLAAPGYAIDIITRKSVQNRLSGSVTAVTKTLKPQTGADVKIPVNDIAQIEWDGTSAVMRGAMGQENNGNFEEAINSYQTVLDETPATSTYIRADLQFFIARSLGKIALQDDTRLPDAITRMKAFTDGNSDSFRYYEAMDYLGRLYLASGDYLKAEATFTVIERSPFEDYQLAAQSSKARVMLAQGQIDQALQAFEGVLKAPGKDEATRQRQLDAMLGKATCLNLKNQYDEALKLLADVVARADENDARLQAEAQVRRGASLLGQGNNQEALMAFLLVDILFPGQQDFHAESLYNLSKLWPIMGQPGRAEEARATLETRYPNSPWTKKLTGS